MIEGVVAGQRTRLKAAEEKYTLLHRYRIYGINNLISDFLLLLVTRSDTCGDQHLAAKGFSWILCLNPRIALLFLRTHFFRLDKSVQSYIKFEIRNAL